MSRRIATLCLVFGLLLVQAPKEVSGRGQNLIRRSRDRLKDEPVIVKVCVQNEGTGRIALDLRAEDFVIEEDGERQKATHFLREERPLSILLMIDSSGSMRPIIQPIIEALSNGLKHLRPDDEVALISFNEAVEILQAFTRNKSLVEEKLRGVVARRPTLTRQALLQAATYMLKATAAESRRVIVVLTDNLPSTPGEVLSEKAVMQQLSASASVVCGVIVSNPIYHPPAGFSVNTPKPTADIIPYVAETGGILERVKNLEPEGISATIVKTLDALRNYYLIAYYSTDARKDGRHHKIKVTLSPRVKTKGGKLTLLAKRGYYAPDCATSGEKR